MSKKKTKYTATLTLTQDGLDGDIISKLKFDPLIGLDDIDADGNLIVPEVFELMSIAAQSYLQAAGILNEHGELIDEEKLREVTEVEASDQVKRKLN